MDWDECKKIINDSKCQFVSLCYLSNKGEWRQLDCFAERFQELLQEDINHIVLGSKLIPYRSFVNVFRNQSTLSIFCEQEIANNPRAILTQHVENTTSNEQSSKYSSYIYCSLVKKGTDHCQYNFTSEFGDAYANLRADIVLALEKNGITTTVHYSDIDTVNKQEKIVIGICAKDALDLADNIVISRYIIANAVSNYGFDANFDSGEGVVLLKLIIQCKQQVDQYFVKNRLGYHIIEYQYNPKSPSWSSSWTRDISTSKELMPYEAITEILASR